jgi:hypothetical protein
MLLIFAVQLGVPALLAALMLWRPAQNAVGVGFQLAGSLMAILAIGRLGIWLFPPWWTPWVAAALVMLGALRILWHPDRLSVWPSGRHQLLLAGGWTMVALLSAWGQAPATYGRRPPVSPAAVELALPVVDGEYLVVNGGNVPQLNAHRASADTSNAHLQPWRGNGHAVDLVAVNRWGLRARGLRPRDPARYESFGRPVVAPCGGRVAAVEGRLPDMPVPEWDRDNIAGNHVLIECQGVHVLLGHLQQHSVLVALGDHVAVGDRLGAIGNSGGTDEPHLHVHAQLPGPAGAPFAGDPLPMRLDGEYLVRGSRLRLP